MEKWSHTEFGGVFQEAKEEFFPLETLGHVYYSDSSSIDIAIIPEVVTTEGVATPGCQKAKDVACSMPQKVTITADTYLETVLELPQCYDKSDTMQHEMKTEIMAKAARSEREAEISGILKKLVTTVEGETHLTTTNVASDIIDIASVLSEAGVKNSDMVFFVSEKALNAYRKRFVGNETTGVFNGVVNPLPDLLSEYGFKNIVTLSDDLLGEKDGQQINVIGYSYNRNNVLVTCKKDPAFVEISKSGVGIVEQFISRKTLGNRVVDEKAKLDGTTFKIMPVCYSVGSVQGATTHSHKPTGKVKQ